MKGHITLFTFRQRTSFCDSLFFIILTFKMATFGNMILIKDLYYIILEISLKHFRIVTHIYPASFSIKTHLRNRNNSTKPSTASERTLKLMVPLVSTSC